jgi:hypothetical protein
LKSGTVSIDCRKTRVYLLNIFRTDARH